jgi:MFS family permease
MGLFGALTFLPLYAQGVLGYSAQDAGVLSPFMLGFVLGSLVGGQMTTRTGRYKTQTTIGMALAVIGMFLLSRLSASSPFSQALIAMIVTGLASAPSSPPYRSSCRAPSPIACWAPPMRPASSSTTWAP